MLRSYLPGLGLSAAVVVAAFAIYSFVHGGDGSPAGRSSQDGDAVEVRLPPVPGGAEEEDGGGGGGGRGGPVELAGDLTSGPAGARLIEAPGSTPRRDRRGDRG
ncbi:MAG TPA: hypothetical protein VKA57_04355, partial [Solirubrobacteraceae bacterium]|nr:hypothetical protein [Solirubrobacteraceae bacterium]